MQGHQPITIAMNDWNGDLLADTHNISNRMNNFFCQLLDAHMVGVIRQVKISTSEP
jgi:hypothetical protein